MGAGSPAQPLLPSNVIEKLRGLLLRLEQTPIGRLVWDGMLSADDRAELIGGGAESDFISVLNRNGGPVGAWMRVRQVSQPRAIIDLAQAVHLLGDAEYRWLDEEIRRVDPMLSPGRRRAKRPRRRQSDPDVRVRRAAAKCPLVLVQGNGNFRVYWRGKRVRQKWERFPRLWEFIWSLAAAARAGKALGWDELSDPAGGGAIRHRKRRLVALLPAELSKLIVPWGERGTYKLQLRRNDIALIELGPGEFLTS